MIATHFSSRYDGRQVARIGDEARSIFESITIGRDYGDLVEVLSGLTATDQVILNPSDSLLSGTAVRLADKRSPRVG